MRVARDWFEYHELKARGVAVAKPGANRTTTRTTPTQVLPTNVQQPTTQPGGSDMDLGTLATDLLRQAGTAYIQRELGPRPVSYQPADFQLGDIVDIPFVDIVPDGTAHKCKRRRRRPIVTPSEISQLASLKAIASPAEVKLFLAKRLRT